jgi:branched-chain amino acid transport system substrate-binding protein
MCQAQASVVAKGPVLWCLSPGIHPAAGSFAFATAQDTQDYIEACLRYAIGRGWHKLGVVSTTDASGQDFDAGFDRISSRPEFRSVTIVDREHFNVADLSVAAVVSRVKNAGPDALLTWVTGSAFSTFLRALADAGVDDPLFSSPVNLLAAQLKSIQPIVPSTLMFPATASYAPNMLIGPLKHVVLDYLDALHAAGMTPDQSTAVPWSEPLIVVQGLNKLGPDATAEQLRAYLASYVGPGVMGQYNFPAHPQRGLDASTVVIILYDKAHQSFVPVSRFGGVPQ